MYALAAAGQAGVERALTLMKQEIERDMRLMGVKSIAELSRKISDPIDCFVDYWIFFRAYTRFFTNHAIGAQNVFVLRQGLLGKHILPVVLFCSFSDALLIFIGISGASSFLTEVVQKYSTWIFWPLGFGYYFCRY